MLKRLKYQRESKLPDKQAPLIKGPRKKWPKQALPCSHRLDYRIQDLRTWSAIKLMPEFWGPCMQAAHVSDKA